jgi:hypothetical protein
MTRATQRAVEVAKEGDKYRVTTFCPSLPDAMATVDKILHSAVPGACEPAPPVAPPTTIAVEPTTPELPPATEAALEVIGTRDADESGPIPMDESEARAR